jgi:leader peptidase (prepilin peptidase)/N-methyltransferase
MALLALVYGWRLDLLAAALFSVPILIILLVDWWTRLIYTNVIGLGLILGLGAAAIEGWSTLVNSAFSAVGAAAVFGLLFVIAAVIYRNVHVVPFGLGDVYLAAMIGSMVRFPAVVSALFLGVFLAGVILMLLLATKRVSRRTAVPYGPFLCAGALISIAVA